MFLSNYLFIHVLPPRIQLNACDVIIPNLNFIQIFCFDFIIPLNPPTPKKGIRKVYILVETSLISTKINNSSPPNSPLLHSDRTFMTKKVKSDSEAKKSWGFYRTTVTGMIEPAPVAIATESSSQVIDTVGLIGPLGIRIGPLPEAQLPHRLCINKIKPQINQHYPSSKLKSVNLTQIQVKFK